LAFRPILLAIAKGPRVTFEELCHYFELVRSRFNQAQTLEEKQHLIAISQQIIKRVDAQITQRTRTLPKP
jgi:hypothetical protein